MAQLSEEQQRRVEQIKRYSRLSYTVSDDNQVAAGLLRDARTDIEFLLSLLSSDSQATKLDHSKLAHEFIARNLTHMPSEDLHRLQIPRLVEEITAALGSTTTAMRDKCREVVLDYFTLTAPEMIAKYGAHIPQDAIASLTLDQVKPEK